MKKSQWIFGMALVGLLLPFFSGSSFALESKLEHVVSPQYEAKKARPRRFWAELGGVTDFRLDRKGGALQVGAFLSRLWTADLRATYARAGYGSIRAQPDYSVQSDGSQYPATEVPEVDPDNPDAPLPEVSELKRARFSADQWTMTLLEPGIAVQSRLFLDLLPLLSQRARFGVARAWMNDNANGKDFTGWLFSFEAGFGYQMGPDSPWTLEYSMNYHFGHVTASDRQVNRGALPLSFLGSMVGLKVAF